MPDVTVETIIRELPLLPVIGFVFALSYERMFFFSLSIELRQILTLTDLVEASALKILPAIPVLFIGFWVGANEPRPRAESGSQRVRNFFTDPINLLGITVVFSATMYVLFGIGAVVGFASSAMILLLLFARIAIFPALICTGKETFLTVWLLLVCVVAFATMGHIDAHTIRFGDRSKLPLVTTEVSISDKVESEFRLVRVLSSGMLVATEDKARLWFIKSESSSVITFETDPVPFQGLLCGGFGWCPIKPYQT